ncbi:MAG: helix-turn-helix transcriptional regulator [Angelakisella sp.]|mgnify:CR=1 FL=1|jgi:transcriptional regulator with XRE-family HTH domain|nr:helix-turn-helix transcriptional regulator [Angelakisella sp.]
MLGDRLSKLRQERNLSQRELGEIILVSGYTISAYELGRSDPSDDIKVRLAQFFDVSVDYLIGLIDQPLSYRRDANVVMLPRNLSDSQKENLRTFLSSLEEMDWVGAEKREPVAAKS